LQSQITASFLSVKLHTEIINKKYDPLTLVTPHGTLNQPNSILSYLAGDQLKGQSEEDKTRVNEWF
jgi:hypothetical protein